MVEGFNPIRYSVIEDKNPREIVMLVGDGCKWRKCRFCDYHLDSSKDIEANFQLNKQVLSNVTGKFGELEVINSGSFVDLDKKTIELIKQICLKKGIKEIHFECHYMHKDDVQNFKNSFLNIGIKPIIKLGLETFDYDLREKVLVKGIEEKSPEVIANYFVNIMVENQMPIKPDKKVIEQFVEYVYPLYKDNDRVDILLNNTDFGVG